MSQVAALGAASIVALRLSLIHLVPSYVVWFAPLALVATTARGRDHDAAAQREAEGR